MNGRNLGQLTGRLVAIKPHKDQEQVWFLLSVMSLEKDEKGYYVTNAYPCQAYGKIAEFMKKNCIVGQTVILTYELGLFQSVVKNDTGQKVKSSLFIKPMTLTPLESKAMVEKRGQTVEHMDWEIGREYGL